MNFLSTIFNKSYLYKLFLKRKAYLSYFIFLSGCGGANQNSFLFISPQVSYGLQNSGQEANSYWLSALTKNQVYPNNYLNYVNAYDGYYKFSFPQNIPNYLTQELDLNGWQPVSAEVKTAARNIFNNISEIVNISFQEVTDVNDVNVIAIMANVQDNTTGYAYEPAQFFLQSNSFLFSDVFINVDNQTPSKIGNNYNFDYELLVHELGHTIGLTHPFTANSGDGSLIPSSEENNKWTVMSYQFTPDNYDENYRPLDLAALVYLYGINPNYKSSNDIYSFNSSEGFIIIDGGGIDSIDASKHDKHLYIDLRSNTQSYVEYKSDMISSPNQFSVGNSVIENATGGSGNDWIIGNDENNILIGGPGNDVLYGAMGEDTFQGQMGDDIIDFTESISSIDVLIMENHNDNGTDVIFNFSAGLNGDKIDFSKPYVPTKIFGTFSNSSKLSYDISKKIISFYGQNMTTESELEQSFQLGILDNIEIENGSEAYLITSKTNNTGEDQHLFFVENNGMNKDVSELAVFKGEKMDIDVWSEANFL